MTQVAAYCRVSTDREDQANSFQAQQRFFHQYITQHPDWELFNIYADEGITGTTTKKREQFMRMIADARAGRFQLIVTKEISRFSRNILDTVAYTRELRALGVGVLFLTENLNTLDPSGEMLLTFMGTMAQEESRRTSVRVKWGQTRQMERGIVFGKSILGYDVKDGHMTVVPEEAAVVQRIFRMYAIEKMSSHAIASTLREERISTHSGHFDWTPGYVVRILKNEKYVGDLIQKKTITPDYLTHQKRVNRGEEPFIILHNHHTPIISRALWDAVHDELLQRNRHNSSCAGHSTRYALSGKICCGECGAPFIARCKYLQSGKKILRWSCRTAVTKGAAVCPVGKVLRDDDAMQMLQQALQHLSFDRDALLDHLIHTAIKRTALNAETLRRQLQRLAQKKLVLLDTYSSGKISLSEMQASNAHFAQQQSVLQQQLSSIEKQRTTIENIRHPASEALTGKAHLDLLCRHLVDKITVYKDRHIELTLHHLPHVFHFTE